MIKDFFKYFISFVIGVLFILFIPKQCKDKNNIDREIDILESKIDSLQRVNVGLMNDADEKEVIVLKLKRNNDSLENVKTKIKQNYVIKYKEIDTLSPNGLVNEFKNIFSAIN
jgi:hypothetical protein